MVYLAQLMQIAKKCKANYIIILLMAELDLSRHSLNQSQSKQKYSFPKTIRFNQSSKPLCDLLYQVPSTFSKRATSLGYGDKTLGIKDSGFVPGVGSYNMKGSFNPQQNKNRAISFGVSRECMQLGGPLGSLKYLKQNPAPCTYKVKDVNDYRGTTLRSRHPDHEFQKYAKNPGPGTYQHENMGSKSYYLNSRYQNNTNIRISQVSRLQPLNKKIKVGPGDYKAVDQMNGDGRYTLTKHQGINSCVFPRAKREGIVQKGSLLNPGPGHYKSFSGFG